MGLKPRSLAALLTPPIAAGFGRRVAVAACRTPLAARRLLPLQYGLPLPLATKKVPGRISATTGDADQGDPSAHKGQVSSTRCRYAASCACED